METEGCPYLDLGTGCRPSAQVLLHSNLTLMHFERLIRKDSKIRKKEELYACLIFRHDRAGSTSPFSSRRCIQQVGGPTQCNNKEKEGSPNV